MKFLQSARNKKGMEAHKFKVKKTQSIVKTNKQKKTNKKQKAKTLRVEEYFL